MFLPPLLLSGATVKLITIDEFTRLTLPSFLPVPYSLSLWERE
jgi:hypothetical protein